MTLKTVCGIIALHKWIKTTKTILIVSGDGLMERKTFVTHRREDGSFQGLKEHL